MLKLHRLELSGFKSFPDPDSLEFAGGLTAVVGPNGCGKSNLADAVIWVLGERSAKSLRGETMEDVIFKGSAGRKPLGMAEVTLWLETDPEFPHAVDGRLAVGRRVFGNGESVYLLNGKPARLKEIHDLLMDTGLGIRAYSVIEQGKIGQILSGKPQERRRLLEEAAGITRYKQRKRLAEIKLEETNANLLRLNDIVAEVERSLRSLKRQAGAARRFHERKRRLRDLQRAVLLGRWALLHRDLETLRRRLAEATATEEAAAAALRQREAALAGERRRQDELAGEVARRHQRDAELAAAIEGKQEFLKGSGQRLQEIADRVAAGEALTQRTAEDLARHRAALEELVPGHGALAEERGVAARHVDEDRRHILGVEECVAEVERRLESLRSRLLTSLAELSALRNRLHREQVEAEKGGYRLKHLAADLEDRTGALERARGSSAEALAKSEVVTAAVAAGEAEVGAAQATLSDLEARCDALSARLAEESHRRAEDLQRQRLLIDLGRAASERRAALRRRLEEAGLEEADLLADRLRVPAGWERTLDLFLGELAEAAVVPPGADPLAVAAGLAASQGASRLIEPLPQAAGVPVEDAAVEGPLGAALGLPSELAGALPPAYLVATPADARRLARLHPGVAFLARERLWAQGGMLHVEGAESGPGALARETELAEIARRLPRLELAIQKLTADRQGVEARQDLLGEEIEIQETRLASLRQELAVAEARRADLGAAEQRLAREVETLFVERQEVERELGRVSGSAAQLATDLTAAETRHGDLETEFDAVQGEVQGAREERERARTSGVDRRGRLELLDQRLESVGRELERTRDQIAEGERQLASWAEESETLARRQEEIRTAMAQADAELRTALERRERSRQEVEAEQERLDACRAGVAALEETLAGERERLDLLRSAAADLKVGQAGRLQDGEHLRAEARQELHEELPEPPPDPPANLPELEADLARCREDLERLGPVNELAATEFDEQETRQRFLVEQRADVERSAASLRGTIREINQTSSERFLRTFQEVNEGFRQTFVHLFRGGEAEMRLLDDEDPLEAGIEIVARPPGKRAQNIMLLSGGEKALTAIALLFALFRTKPSPFCILDEVDAPLDDVNTLRFVDMLRDMANDTQFIVITHNKLTMEACARLYGVTMQERGVSRVVAVELDEVQPQALATA